MASREAFRDHKHIFLLAAVLPIGGLVFVLHRTQANAPTVATRDAQRISDLQQVQSARWNSITTSAVNILAPKPVSMRPGLQSVSYSSRLKTQLDVLFFHKLANLEILQAHIS